MSDLFDVPLSSDEDFDLSSETDLGEGDSSDEDGVNDVVIEQVSPLLSDEENDNVVISPTPRNTIPSTSRARVTSQSRSNSQNNFIWLDESPNLEHIDFNEIPGLKIRPDGDQPIDFLNLLLNDYFYDFSCKRNQ